MERIKNTVANSEWNAQQQNCESVGTVRICKSFTMHGVNIAKEIVSLHW